MSNDHQWMYKTKVWRKLRESIIQHQPLCQSCLRLGRVRTANAVHHIRAHKGRWFMFVDPKNLESICNNCHNSEMQFSEKMGYNNRSGSDGWPIDPKHPHNQLE